MKKLTKALLALGAGAACVVTGGLAAPALGAAVGVTGIAAKVAGTAAKATTAAVAGKIIEAKKK